MDANKSFKNDEIEKEIILNEKEVIETKVENKRVVK
jgi:hypothetical protein